MMPDTCCRELQSLRRDIDELRAELEQQRRDLADVMKQVGFLRGRVNTAEWVMTP
jgi:chromosome segregation ATPase